MIIDNMEAINHDKIFEGYFGKLNEYLHCYLHDIFKSIVARGGRDGRECDITASISEQYSKFAINKVREVLEKLCSIILSPITLSPMIYIDSRGNILKVNFKERFDDLPRYYVKDFLNYKYGNDIYNKILEKITSGDKLNSYELIALIDASRFMVQRSWISANDITIHAHLRGALLASLNNISLIRISNPFYSEYNTLKDIEGIYAITKIFLYYLNSCLLERLTNTSLNNVLKRLIDELPEDKYATPLIDFYTPFIFDADERSITLFYVKDKLNDVKECIKSSFTATINEVLSKLARRLIKIKETITYKLDLVKEHENMLNNPEALNEFLEVPNSVLFAEIENAEVELEGIETEDRLCSVCKLRKSVREDLIPTIITRKTEDRLCNICLSVRLAPYAVGRTSTLKRGDRGDTDIEKEGWYNLFKKIDNRGRSIDELVEGYDDNVIFLGIKLDLKKWDNRDVSLIEAYHLNLENLRNSVKEFLKDVRDRILSGTDPNVDFVVNNCVQLKDPNPEKFEKVTSSFIDLLTSQSKRIDINEFTNKISDICDNIFSSKELERLRNNIKNLLKNHIDYFNEKVEQLKNEYRCDLNTIEVENIIRNFIDSYRKIEISKSLDRLFSIKQNFSVIIEYFMALLYIKKVGHITLIEPSITTPFFLAVIRKKDFKKLFNEVLYPFFKKFLEDSRYSISNLMLVYIIKAKSYTPIKIIKEIINTEPKPLKDSTVLLIPVIVNRNSLPVTELIGIDIYCFKKFMDLVEKEILDEEALIRLLRSSAEDLPYPAFEDCNKLPEICSDIMSKWVRGKVFSIHHDNELKLKGYIARLLT